jgi:ATP-dependent Lhr-like helicase
VWEWFSRHFPSPTPAQRLAWPALMAGRHVLLVAPTGGGKTFAAFVPVFNDLIRRPGSGLRCVYVAPLRALCNDVRRNLESALAEVAPGLHVAVRTGDTDARERRRLLRQPPEVLLTTPESLGLLLCHPEWRRLLQGVRWLIVDEVHCLAGTKRGADLAVSLERLCRLAEGDPVRLGLSATCEPVAEAARWLGGPDRDVAVAQVPHSAPLSLSYEYLGRDIADKGFLAALLERLTPWLDRDQGTALVFTNVRSLAERLAWLLRRRRPARADAVAVHHSALARETRARVEQDLKAGRLRVVVSSTSLELGIDIGYVDQVILIHPPGGAARLLQRLGRAGHAPGRPRCGLVVVGEPHELLEAAATAGAARLTQLEPLACPRAPLDVLCQQLVGMAVERPHTAWEAYSLLRATHPFRDLGLADFVSCLEYLCGGDGVLHVPARLRWEDGRFLPRNGVVPRIYRMNVGTIAAEEAKPVRLASGLTLGHVGEFFADTLQPGDRFLLGGRCLELTAGDRDGLEVKEAGGRPVFTHWAGGAWDTPQALAERIWWLRVRTREALLEGPEVLLRLLAEEYDMDVPAVEALAAHLQGQEALSEIPASELLVEAVTGPDGECCWYDFHLPLGAAGSAAVARVAAWRLGRGRRVVAVPGCLGFTLLAPAEVELEPETLRRLLDPQGFGDDLLRAVAGGPAAGDRFRQVAETGLMLLRNPLGRRRRVGGRDWAGRRLMNWLRFAAPRFPLLEQTFREVRDEVFDAPSAVRWLRVLSGRPIRLRVLPERSPFAEAWGPAPRGLPPDSLDETLSLLAETTEARACASTTTGN